MSQVSLTYVKAALHVTHDQDDMLIQSYIDAAEKEALQFLDKPSFTAEQEFNSDDSESWSDVSSSSESVIPDDIQNAIVLLVRSKYDATDAVDIGTLRSAAESILMPNRANLGV